MAQEVRDYLDFGTSFMKQDSARMYPSIEALYGPYPTPESGVTKIVSVCGEALPLGLKFGVDDGTSFKEYMFKNGRTDAGIVELHNAVGSLTSVQVDDDRDFSDIFE